MMNKLNILPYLVGDDVVDRTVVVSVLVLVVDSDSERTMLYSNPWHSNCFRCYIMILYK
jgi:hypothetical protein